MAAGDREAPSDSEDQPVVDPLISLDDDAEDVTSSINNVLMRLAVHQPAQIAPFRALRSRRRARKLETFSG